jgi:hypothetical protein
VFAALTDDLDRLGLPLAPGRAIVGPSRSVGAGSAAATTMIPAQAASGVGDAAGHHSAEAPTGPTSHTAGAPTAPASAAPIFVDSSGQRRRLARRLSFGVIGILCGYGCLVAVSFAGGPIPPAALLPVPGMPAAKNPAPEPAPAAPAPSTPSGAASGSKPHQGPLVPGVSRTSEKPSASPSPAGLPKPSSSLPATPLPSGATSVSASPTTHGNPSAPGRTKHSTSPTP